LELPDDFAWTVKGYHPGHILQDVVPRLKKMGISDEQIDLMLVENPKRFFGY
jgi:phosphotriesterase-related protein